MTVLNVTLPNRDIAKQVGRWMMETAFLFVFEFILCVVLMNYWAEIVGCFIF